MPSGNSYMKKNVLEAEKRAKMVRLAISPYPYFSLSALELERQGNSYTAETLEALTSKNPDTEYYFIVGADTFFNIELWRQPEKIFLLAKIACAVRDDYDIDKLRRKGNQLSRDFGADIVYLNMPKAEISSTDIRAMTGAGLPILDFVPSAVAEYIQQERLYEEN